MRRRHLLSEGEPSFMAKLSTESGFVMLWANPSSSLHKKGSDETPQWIFVFEENTAPLSVLSLKWGSISPSCFERSDMISGGILGEQKYKKWSSKVLEQKQKKKSWGLLKVALVPVSNYLWLCCGSVLMGNWETLSCTQWDIIAIKVLSTLTDWRLRLSVQKGIW